MYTGKYKIAGKIIEVNSQYKRVHDYCKDYSSDEPADFSVIITTDDILFEKQKTASEFEYEGIQNPDFSDGLLEETAVYRKIAEKMPDYDSFVFHGSVIAVDGIAYLFTAKSGTGKSTHTRLWRERFGDRAVMVNDDKPLISVGNNGIIAYGTPYNGKHRLGNNISVPLKAICILERSAENHIRRISKAEAYAMLLQQVYRPHDNVHKEYGITDNDIIGVMTSFVHNGKKHSVNETGYRLYSCIWVGAAPLRVLLMRAEIKLKRLIKR